MIVMKFGGSSLESAFAIRRVCTIIGSSKEKHPIVVVSAIGKTTNRLCELEELRASGNETSLWRSFEHLKRFHLMLAGSVASGSLAHGLELETAGLLEDLKATLQRKGAASPANSDAVLSFGERLSSVIFTAALRQNGLDSVHLDSRRAIITDNRFTQAAPLFVETNAQLRRLIRRNQITVMGGFIGATEEGEPTTLGRGGSDYTAAIVGGAICADEIQIWTDVDGMLTCDPRVVPNGHCLRSISYEEAEEMAKAGAKVLHPATVAPAIRQRIPIVIRNSQSPDAPGTRIVPKPLAEGAVLSIACRTGITMLHLVHRDAPNSPDFADRLWNLFQLKGVEFQVVAVSRERFSVVLDQAALTPSLVAALNQAANAEVLPDRAIVTLIGHRVGQNSSSFIRAARAVHQEQNEAVSMPIHLERFGFVIPQSNLAAVANRLHTEFFAEPDPTLFAVNRYNFLESSQQSDSLPRNALVTNPAR